MWEGKSRKAFPYPDFGITTKWVMEAVVFVELQASGKSTFYKERFFSTDVPISLDLFRTWNRERRLDLH